MKKRTVLAVMTALLLVFACNQPTANTPVATDAIGKDSLITRGLYLVTTMGCNDCHSPKIFTANGPQPDPNLLLSGHPSAMPVAFIDTAATKNWVLFNGMNTAVAGPWGVSFSANLTSDSTGIGNWTEAQFAIALRQGKSKGLEGNRMLLPPMPWPNYVNLTDADLKAIFAYLKSTKPIKNVVPAPIPPTALNKKG